MRCVLLLLLLLLLPPLGRSQPLPALFSSDCVEFRERLSLHSAESRFDRAHSTNLGLSSLALFWTGVPALPLGISAVVLGRRMDTAHRRALVRMGVGDANWRRVNTLCAQLLRRPEIQHASFQGANRVAVALGAVALALATVVTLAMAAAALRVKRTRPGKGNARPWNRRASAGEHGETEERRESVESADSASRQDV